MIESVPRPSRDGTINAPGLKSRLAFQFVLSAPILGALLFAPAGSLRFWPAWVFTALFFSASLMLAVYFYRRDPALLERRLETKEQATDQKLIRKLWIALWIVGLSLPGFDFREGWSRELFGSVPLWLTLVAQGLVLCSYFLVFQALKANSYASSVVKVEAAQQVISDGPYGIVRHPMYSGLLVLLLSLPLSLGSYVAVPVFVLLIATLVFRLLSEEKTLHRELPGYSEYCRRTRFRLVPLLW